MKKHAMISAIIGLATCAIMLFAIVGVSPAIAGAQDHSFTISGEVRFQKCGTMYLKVLNEEQFKSGDDDDADDGGPADTPASYVARLELDIEDVCAGAKFFEFQGIPRGSYVVQAYQDVNANGEFDMGLLGPKEPWGMSRMTRKPVLRGPRWDEVSIDVAMDITGVIIPVR
jgi:uncharacterized protein (DUF2141 family)